MFADWIWSLVPCPLSLLCLQGAAERDVIHHNVYQGVSPIDAYRLFCFQRTQQAHYLPRWTLLACRSLISFAKQFLDCGILGRVKKARGFLKSWRSQKAILRTSGLRVGTY